MRSSVKSRSRAISSGTRSVRSSGVRVKGCAAKFLYDRYVGNDPEQVAAYEEEILNAEIARRIFDMRTKAGLSQRELAERVGTSASAICRLEDGDYEGHSLSLLKRIAEALDRRVEVRFVRAKRRRSRRRRRRSRGC